MSKTSSPSDDLRCCVPSKMAWMSPLSTCNEAKEGAVLRSPTNTSDSSSFPTRSSDYFTGTRESISNTRGRTTGTITNDAGPRTGNRATSTPRRISAPDVDAFLKHMATHSRRSSSLGNSSSLSKRRNDSGVVFNSPISPPHYTALDHGETRRLAPPHA